VAFTCIVLRLLVRPDNSNFGEEEFMKLALKDRQKRSLTVGIRVAVDLFWAIGTSYVASALPS
jgi:hypothetical protein